MNLNTHLNYYNKYIYWFQLPPDTETSSFRTYKKLKLEIPAPDMFLSDYRKLFRVYPGDKIGEPDN
jgi:hypothetical protein